MLLKGYLLAPAIDFLDAYRFLMIGHIDKRGIVGQDPVNNRKNLIDGLGFQWWCDLHREQGPFPLLDQIGNLHHYLPSMSVNSLLTV